MTAQPITSNLGVRAALDALLALLNTGGAGSIQIFTGSPPATTLTADSGTKVATLTLSATAFPASSNDGTGGAAGIANAITSDTDATGSATAAGYFRAKSGAGTVIIQGTVGTSAADLILTSATIAAHSQVAITSWVVTLPSGAASS